MKAFKAFNENLLILAMNYIRITCVSSFACLMTPGNALLMRPSPSSSQISYGILRERPPALTSVSPAVSDEVRVNPRAMWEDSTTGRRRTSDLQKPESSTHN